MAINATSNTEFKRVAPGNYIARCYSIIELGTIDTEWNGKKKKTREVLLTWELPNELEVFDEEKGYEPYSVSKRYTLSLYQSHLRKDLESWRGVGFTEKEAESFDVTKLLSVPCMLNIIHTQGKQDTSKTFVQVASVSPLPKGITCPDQLNPSRLLSFDNWNQQVFEGLMEKTRTRIQSSDEYKNLNTDGTEAGTAREDDHIDIVTGLPF
jgi:hypothetical protein